MEQYKISNVVSEEEYVVSPDGKVITNKAQIEFIKLMGEYQSGDAETQAKALEAMCDNMKFYVKRVVNTRFASFKDEADDLQQEGMMGFVEELKKGKYDPYRSAPTTYFDQAIGHSIRSYITKNVSKTTPYYHSSMKKIRAAIVFLETNGQEVSEVSIAQVTDLPLSTIRQCMVYEKNLVMPSMDEPKPNSDENHPQTLRDTVPDIKGKTPESLFFEKEKSRVLHDAVNSLSEQEQEIIRLHFGLDCERMDIKSLAKKEKCSVDDIRAAVNRACSIMANNKELAGICGRKPGFNPEQPFEFDEAPDMSPLIQGFMVDEDGFYIGDV